MTRIYALLFAVALTLNACATVGPIAITCGIQDIAILAADYNQIVADYKARDWADLVREAEKLGWATIDCVGSSAATKDPALAPSVKEFRSLHAVELRAAGVSACNGLPLPSPEIGTGSQPAAMAPATLSACDAARGKPLTGIATHGRCMCWRESKTNWRESRWVAVGEMPGAGLVAAR
jgi:hypothetical protein